MVYSKSNEKFDVALFKAPTSEYRGIPFWAWTGKPDKNVMAEQISDFRKMGFGGYFVHSRVGLDVEFLGEEFLEDIAFCRDKGSEEGLVTCLYDEDKWPSGFGGGRVTEDPRYASRYLLLSPVKLNGDQVKRQAKGHTRLSDSGEIKLLKRFAISFENGMLKSYSELATDETSDQEWYLYLVVSQCLDWFNGRQYANVLNSGTAQRFIETTYNRYAEAFEKDFGNHIPVIFTDEPSYKRYETMENSMEPSAVGFPYSDDVELRYIEKYGESFLSKTPELIFNLEGGIVSAVRYRYFDICAELFSDAFIGNLGAWCAQKGIALTGHFQDENALDLQAKACGDVMRAMAGLDIPGVDILFDGHEYFTLKQAQSVARQYGKPGQAAELYGVTNWDFDLASHKHQGDWVTALGNTMRIPHLSWMSMKGEMKRDFPASINHCVPWHNKYGLIEDHFARVAVALTRGTPVVRVAVLDPVESMWMLLGPDNEQEVQRRELEQNFKDLCETLLFHQVDFDILNEALLQNIGNVKDGRFVAGKMAYDAVILPDLHCVRSTTVALLRKFGEVGGKILITGHTPQYVDGLLITGEQKEWMDHIGISVPNEKLIAALRDETELTIDNGDELIYQLRQDAEERWLFVAHGKKPKQDHEDIVIRMKGTWHPQLYDTVDGNVSALVHTYRDGETVISYKLFADDSLLIRLCPERAPQALEMPDEKAYKPVAAPVEASYHLEEPNIMLLDMVYYSIDGGPWQGPEEILRADKAIRNTLNYRLRSEGNLQPWCIQNKEQPHRIGLKYKFRSEISCECRPAVECAEGWEICLNGKPLQMEDSWFIDRAIRFAEKCYVQPGENELSIWLPFGEHTNLEAVYLTGDFAVMQREKKGLPVMTALPEKLRFDSITEQGFLFYGGNLRYDMKIKTELESVRIRLPKYAGAMAHIALGGDSKDVFLSPQEAVFAHTKPGEHQLSITILGNRINTFGQLHNRTGVRWCLGSNAYRTEGDGWTYDYVVKNAGLLAPPEIAEG